jgi:hypothetical protein
MVLPLRCVEWSKEIAISVLWSRGSALDLFQGPDRMREFVLGTKFFEMDGREYFSVLKRGYAKDITVCVIIFSCAAIMDNECVG